MPITAYPLNNFSAVLKNVGAVAINLFAVNFTSRVVSSGVLPSAIVATLQQNLRLVLSVADSAGITIPTAAYAGLVRELFSLRQLEAGSIQQDPSHYLFSLPFSSTSPFISSGRQLQGSVYGGGGGYSGGGSDPFTPGSGGGESGGYNVVVVTYDAGTNTVTTATNVTPSTVYTWYEKGALSPQINNAGIWEERRGLLVPLSSGEVLVAGFPSANKFYLIDAATGTETATGNYAIAGSNGQRYAAYITTPNDVFQVRISGFSVTCASYTRLSNTWAAGAGLSPASSANGGVLVAINDGRMLLIGGYASARTYAYTRSGDSWAARASMARNRGSFAAVVLNDGRVLAIGGVQTNTSGASIVECDVYDPVGNTWTQVASLNVARSRGTAVLLSDGRVLVTGGTNDNSTMLTSAEIYDPNANTWTAVTSLPAAVTGDPGYDFVGDYGQLILDSTTPVFFRAKVPQCYTYNPTGDAWTQQDGVSIANTSSPGTPEYPAMYAYTGVLHRLCALETNPTGDPSSSSRIWLSNVP